MKKVSRFLALLLVFCFIFSLCAFAEEVTQEETAEDVAAEEEAAEEEAAEEEAAEEEAAEEKAAEDEAVNEFVQTDETHWAGGSLTVESVEISDAYADYVDATQFCNVSKIVYDGGEIDIDSDIYIPILTVDGIQVDIYNITEPTSFEGNVVLTLVAKDAVSDTGNAKFGDDAGSLIGPFHFSAAAYFNENGYQAQSSVPEAQYGAVIDNGLVDGMDFISYGDYFGGVYANTGDVLISNSRFIAKGRGADDFTGRGAAVVASGDAHITIQDCLFVTEGALRSAIWAGNSASVDVIGTVVQSYNDEDLVSYSTDDNYATPMMQQVPFALGLTGNVRATLDCGQAAITFTDSLIASNGWAVLSTDSGNGSLVATDTTAVLGYIVYAEDSEDFDELVEIGDEEYGIYYGRAGSESGYIAYCDGFTDYAYGGRWFAPDYLAIITGGAMTIGASEKGRFYGWSDRIGFMSHQTGSATTLTISEADFDVADTFAVIKSKGGNGETISLENVTVDLTGDKAWGGNVLEVMDSDDLGGGPGATTFIIPYGSYEDYLAAPNAGEGGVTTLNVAGTDLTGNVYNSVGSQTGSQQSFKTDSIVVNLENATLTGTISSAYAAHCDENGTMLTGDATVDSYGREGTYDYLLIGRILNFAAPTVNNPVKVVLAKDAAWNVTGLSYVSSLSVGEGSIVNGDVYKDGELVEVEAGAELEDVIVVPAGANPEELAAAAEQAVADAAGAGIVPDDCSDLVQNVDMGSGEMSGEMASSEPSEEPAG